MSFLLFAASAISLPTPGYRVADYLSKKIDASQLDRRGTWVAATVKLWIEPKGRITDCAIVRSLGEKGIVEKICPVLVGMRVKSPRDHKGEKSYGTMSMDFTAFADSLYGRRKEFTDALSAEPMPDDVDGELAAEFATKLDDRYAVTLVVGSDGSVLACEKGGKLPANLTSQACELAGAKSYAIGRSEAGEPVSYVRLVRFVPPN